MLKIPSKILLYLSLTLLVYLSLGLLTYFYLFCLVAALDYFLDGFFYGAIIAIILAGALFLLNKNKWIRYLSFFPFIVVLVIFSFFSPVRPFLSFYFSLDIGMTEAQMRTSLNHHFVGDPGFPLPQGGFNRDDEENNSRIATFYMPLDPFDAVYSCDSIQIIFDRRDDRLISAQYSSRIIPSIPNKSLL